MKSNIINEIVEELQVRQQKPSKAEKKKEKTNIWGIIGIMVACLFWLIVGQVVVGDETVGILSLLFISALIVSIVGCFFKPRKTAFIALLILLLIGPIIWSIFDAGKRTKHYSYEQITAEERQRSNKNIARVKDSEMSSFPTMKVGKTLEGYRYFKSPSWSESVSSQGEHIVTFTAQYYSRVDKIYGIPTGFYSYNGTIYINFGVAEDWPYSVRLRQITFVGIEKKMKDGEVFESQDIEKNWGDDDGWFGTGTSDGVYSRIAHNRPIF